MAAPEGYKTLGKIGISYKGDYNSNIAYERLDAVYHNGSTYLAIKDAPDGAPRDDKLNWIYLAKGFSGDIGYSEIAFTEAENRENINTGESVKTVFGKIKKFFADLTAPAFAQMITSKDDLLATKATGYVPDAKAVADAVTDVTGKLVNIIRCTTIKGNTDGNGIIYIGQQAPDGAMPILVQIGDSTKWFECTILSKSIDNAQHFAARIRNADGSAYANIKNMVIGVLWGV